VVSDFKILVEACMPDVELDSNDMLKPAEVELLFKKLSISDPFYSEYLLSIAQRLGLIKKIPSIHANKAQTTPEYEAFLGKTSKEAFFMIASASIDAASSLINDIIPLPEPYFNKETIYSLLKNPISLDDIYQKVYSMLGVRFQDIYSMDEDSDPFFDDLNSAVISSTFLLGLMLDKYFLTPFGCYLQLIRPMYTLPYDFENELSYLADSFDDEDGPLTAIFAPSTFYSLTPLGIEFFGSAQEDEEQEMLKRIPAQGLEGIIEKLANGSPEDIGALKSQYPLSKDVCQTVYAIKATLSDMKKLWKTIEAVGNTTLHNLFCEICYQFSLDPGSEYSFFMDPSESPFSEYTCPSHPRKSKKADEIALEQLDLQEKRKFTLCIYNTFNPFDGFSEYDNIIAKKITIMLEIAKIKKRSENCAYPRVARMSASFKEFEE
jgi:hypothetical protein